MYKREKGLMPLYFYILLSYVYLNNSGATIPDMFQRNHLCLYNIHMRMLKTLGWLCWCADAWRPQIARRGWSRPFREHMLNNVTATSKLKLFYFDNGLKMSPFPNVFKRQLDKASHKVIWRFIYRFYCWELMSISFCFCYSQTVQLGITPH